MKEILERLDKADRMLSAVRASGDDAILLVYARQELGTALKELKELREDTGAAA